MQHDLRTLAEKVLKRFQAASGCPEGWLEYLGESEVFARAYLAAHPADDGKAVTEAWLRSVGFEFTERNGGQLQKDSYADCRVSFVLRHQTWLVNGYKAADQPTRGHIRRLCECLGVPLRAGEEG